MTRHYYALESRNSKAVYNQYNFPTIHMFQSRKERDSVCDEQWETFEAVTRSNASVYMIPNFHYWYHAIDSKEPEKRYWNYYDSANIRMR